MKSIYVNVKANHIAEASRRDSNHCMIADAIRTLFPQAKYIKVDTQAVRFSDEEQKERYFFFTPIRAQHALLAFDRGEQVKPFHFQLVDGITKPMGWSGTHPNSSRKGKKYRRTGKKRMVAKRERQFGLRKIST